MTQKTITALTRIGRLAGLGLAILALVSGCGEDTDSEPAATQTVTEERTITEEAAAEDPATEEPAEAYSDAPSEEGSGGGDIKVPDVEGKDHQLAQDTMQAAGLYNLSEEDATGQGRALIIDRNWTVVEQDPPAGTVVSEDATITLRSKKDGE